MDINKSLDFDIFSRLLFSVFNISDEVDPESVAGKNYNKGAIKAAKTLFSLLEGKSPNYVKGVTVTIKLLAECLNANNPTAYAIEEIERGWNGDRFEFENIRPSTFARAMAKTYGVTNDI